MPKWVIPVAAIGLVVIFALIIGGMWVSAHNREVSLRKSFENKQVDNKNEYDNMWKKISQVAEVTQEHKKALREIFEGHATARGGLGDGKAIMKWLHEAVPNVDLKTYENLQNIIVSARDRFTMRQKELLDIKRAHDTLLESFPSMLFVGGRDELKAKIVTSTRTEKTFEEGKDDDVGVFSKKEE
jgi:hypothetical protein